MGHSQRVGNYAARIACKMGLPEKRIRRLKTAAVFHDIGKLGISDAILQKPSFLTHDEQMEIWRHPQIGVRILCNIDTYDDLTELVLHHHERYDGGGYPSGTKGKDLQIDTYILSAADTYDAITSDRPYRKGMTPQRAREIILEEKGKQVHPDVAVTVAAMIDSGEINIPVSEEEDMDAE
ncbi:Cyclic di-GMP phosphodiesterase [bioreactor metagenome]|uniref:Cyclic di-GMP phosphodiesterase n=1 Tax=bioreactor metagenome TaxID=1076179 RepID=A0A644YQW4_9ZZZZ